MNFNVKRGEIVAIIGDIGSGKSSLMYSLLGEMKFK
jgi:ABC-type glutathione transport system ATPase component